ncbi:hypothetical protein JD844_011596 [Phrynosoma platyrhinos]|uniref:Uncharacterized protein n=1 Tax=Phrynosoma platyrhinos TaxID=52577 RepID=A0ABQ7TJ41_PHRPL|nr:hypothetical protein JD844_011596 [Phrynosoma platyrhinos]
MSYKDFQNELYATGNKLWLKLQRLPKAEPVEIVSFFVIILFIVNTVGNWKNESKHKMSKSETGLPRIQNHSYNTFNDDHSMLLLLWPLLQWKPSPKDEEDPSPAKNVLRRDCRKYEGEKYVTILGPGRGTALCINLQNKMTDETPSKGKGRRGRD